MSRLEAFATIEELKADRVERPLSAEEIELQKIATDSLAIFRLRRKSTANNISL